MTPYEIVLTVVVFGLLGYVIATRRPQKSQPDAPSPTPYPQWFLPPGQTDNALIEKALDHMAKVAQLALAPYPAAAGTPDEHLLTPRSMGGLEIIQDDDSDPMEVFLGPEFLRTPSAVLDASDESPFGVPGLQPMDDGLD